MHKKWKTRQTDSYPVTQIFVNSLQMKTKRNRSTGESWVAIVDLNWDFQSLGCIVSVLPVDFVANNLKIYVMFKANVWPRDYFWLGKREWITILICKQNMFHSRQEVHDLFLFSENSSTRLLTHTKITNISRRSLKGHRSSNWQFSVHRKTSR